MVSFRGAVIRSAATSVTFAVILFTCAESRSYDFWEFLATGGAGAFIGAMLAYDIKKDPR